MANYDIPTNPTFRDGIRKFEPTDEVYSEVFNETIGPIVEDIMFLNSKKANKTDIPTSLPANGGNANTVNNLTVQTAVPANAKFTDTTYSNATQSANGLMSSADKTKLDGIAQSANNYSLPVASSTTRGGVKTGYTANGKNYPVQLSNEQMYVNVPWSDTNTWRPLGTTADAACAGNDARLSNARPANGGTSTYAVKAQALQTYAQNGASHGDGYLMKCQWNKDGDNKWKFYCDNPDHVNNVKVDYATVANASNYANFSSSQHVDQNERLRNITLSTNDLTAGTSGLSTGSLYVVYE